MSAEQHCPFEPELRRLLDEDLSDALEARLIEHLRECPECRANLDKLASQNSLLDSSTRKALLESPCFEAELVQLIKHLRAKRSGLDATTELPMETGGGNRAAPGDTWLDFLEPSSRPQSLGRIGGYDVLGIMGSGGMGMVLRAEDPTLHRIVAIKVLRPELAANGLARQRFLREAQKAAAVTHDHVVTIHAVGETNGLPYLVMEYVVGATLEERIRQMGPLKVEEILRIGMQAASGLAAAHAQGIVHRDVKPSNILLENGIERVKLADFGLARATDDAKVTQAGIVAGTPEYMSPEQARDEPIDYRSDLFSLDAVLYAMCTGRSPFRASSIAAAIHRVCQDTPRPIRETNPDIPDWLVAIIDRLLAKKPEARFETAARVSEVLGDYLLHVQQPTQFPRPSQPPATTPARKRTFLVQVACAVASVAILLAAVCTSGVFSPVPVTGTGIESGIKTNAGIASPSPLPVPQIASLFVNLRKHPDRQLTIVTVTGEDYTETITTPGWRQLEVPAGLYRIEVRNKHTNELNRFGEVHLNAGDQRRVEIGSLTITWPPLVRYRQPVGQLLCDRPSYSQLALSSDGSLLALPTSNGTIQLWQLHDGVWSEWTNFKTSGMQIRRVAFSPDGNMLAAGGESGNLLLYDVKSPGNMRRLVGHTKSIWSLSFSPDSRILATAGEDSEAFLWDISAALPPKKLPCDQGACVAFCPSGGILATGDGRGNITFWDTADWQPIRIVPAHASMIISLTFTADGTKLASTSPDSTAKIWNVADGQRLHTLGYHRDWTGSADFSPDGELVVTGNGDGALRFWNTADGGLIDEFRAHWAPVLDARFLPDGETLITVGGDGLIQCWNVPEILKAAKHTLPETIEGGPGVKLEAVYFSGSVPRHFSISPDGTTVAIADDRGLVLKTSPDVQTGYHRVTDSGVRISAMAFLDQQTLFIAAGSQIQCWEVSTGNLVHTIHQGRSCTDFAILPNHGWLAVTHGDGSVVLRCLKTGELVKSLPHEDYGPSQTLASTRDGSLLVARLENGQCVLWNLADWDLADPAPSPVLLPFGDTEVTSVSFSEDGQLCASGDVNGIVTVWQVDTWRMLHTLTGIVGRVRDIAFSSDGRLVVAGGGKGNFVEGAEVDLERWDGRAVIWDVQTGSQLTCIHAHLGNTYGVAFTHDGTRLLTLGDAKKLKTWDIRPLLSTADIRQ